MSNCLKGTRIYLSGPIQYDTSGVNWREKPKEVLSSRFGINVFDPYADPKQQWVPMLEKAMAEKDYETMRKIAKCFVRKDLAMVDRADFVIAYLPHKVPTTGTHHEIINSCNAKKPTLLVCPEGKEKVPVWYYGFIPYEVMFGSWDELYDYLEEINQGKHEDNDRWDFVCGRV